MVDTRALWDPPLDQAARALESVESDALRASAIRAGLRSAARPLAKSARRLAPRGSTRLLSRSINVLAETQRDRRVFSGGRRVDGAIGRNEAAVIVGPNKVHLGRRRQHIGRFVEAGTVKMQAQPYLEPAGRTSLDNAGALFLAGVEKRIDQALRRARR